jgi:hypothetical protein
MHTLQDNMTMALLGLERDLWEQVGASEQRLYRTVLHCFALFIILSVASSVYLLFLITSSWWVSVPAAVPVAFIIGSVVRFTLIILRRSIYDPFAGAAPAVATADVSGENAPSAIVPEQAVTAPPPAVPDALPPRPSTPAWRNVMKRLASSLGRLRLPDGHSKVPGLEFLIRTVILSTIGLLVVFPLACLFHLDRLEEVNAANRAYHIRQFEEDGKQNLGTRTRLIRQRMDELRSSLANRNRFYPTEGLIAERENELRRLEGELTREQADFEASYQQTRVDFLGQMEDRHFLVLTFVTVTGMPGFWVALVLVMIVLVVPNLLLYVLKTRDTFTYASLSTAYYRGIIDTEYEKAEREGYAHLARAYKYDPGDFRRSIHWENPPYNTVPRVVFKQRERISSDVFLAGIQSSNPRL